MSFKYLIYLFERAFSLVHMSLNPTLSLRNLIGRLTNITNAIKAKESVVNLAMPQSDEATAKIDKCMTLHKLLISVKYYQTISLSIELLIKSYCI